MMKLLTRSEQDTLRFAGVLAGMLDPGDTVLLSGELGTGKSVVARGIARALGVRGSMPSPTFTLMIPYEGRCPLYHFDLYRLSGPDEFYAAGLDEFIGGDGISLVEWPETVGLDPVQAIRLRLSRGAGDDDRIIVVEPAGVRGFREEALREWGMEA